MENHRWDQFLSTVTKFCELRKKFGGKKGLGGGGGGNLHKSSTRTTRHLKSHVVQDFTPRRVGKKDAKKKMDNNGSVFPSLKISVVDHGGRKNLSDITSSEGVLGCGKLCSCEKGTWRHGKRRGGAAI